MVKCPYDSYGYRSYGVYTNYTEKQVVSLMFGLPNTWTYRLTYE